MNEPDTRDDSVVVPTKMAKATRREIEWEATRMATAKENTIPTLEKVRSIPEAMPNTPGGAAFITAELLAGKKPPVPVLLMTLPSTTTHRAVRAPRWAYTASATTSMARPGARPRRPPHNRGPAAAKRAAGRGPGRPAGT